MAAGENLGTLGTAFVDILVDDDRVEGQLTRLQRTVRSVGAGLGAALGGAALVKTFTAIVGAASEFESSFAGVRRTVDASEPQFARLREDFRKLALEIPVPVAELNKIGEAAGQLGIQTASVVGFTRVVAELASVTNVGIGQAADDMARLANVTGMEQTQENFSRLASTIVELGKSEAASETQILDFGLRIAGAGKIAGLTVPQVLSIGTAMASVGVEAEAGGTAVQKVLISMTQAAALGGKDLETFADVAKMTAADFKTSFQKDAGAAFQLFVEGLRDKGNDAFTVLDELGLGNERVIRSFISLANSGKLLGKTFEEGNKGWRENASLAEATAERYKTFSAQVQLLKSAINDAAITLGDKFLPALGGAVKGAREFFDEASRGEGAINGLAGAVVALGAAYGAVKLGTLAKDFYQTAVAAGTVSKQVTIYSDILFKRAVAEEAARVASINAAAAATASSSAMGLMGRSAATATPQLITMNAGLVTTTVSSWSLSAAAKAVGASLLTMVPVALVAALAATGYQVGIVYNHVKALAAAGGEAEQAQASFERATIALAQNLKESYGVEILRAGRSTAEWNAELVAVGATLGGELRTQTNAAAEDQKRMAAGLAALRQAAADAKVKLTELQQKFVDALKPADSLEAEVAKLQKTFSQTDIIRVYGEEIIKATESQRAHGAVVSDNIRILYDLAKAARTTADAQREQQEETKRLTEEHNRLNQAFQEELKPADALEQEMTRLTELFGRENVIKIYGDRILEAAAAQREHGYAVSQNIELLERMTVAAQGVATAAKAAASVPIAGPVQEEATPRPSRETTRATREVSSTLEDMFGGLNSGLQSLNLGPAPSRRNQQTSIDLASYKAAINSYLLDPFGVQGAARNAAPGGIYSAGQTSGAAFGGTGVPGTGGGARANFGPSTPVAPLPIPPSSPAAPLPVDTAAAIEALRVSAGIPSTGLATSASEIFARAVDRFEGAVARIGNAGGAGVGAGGINAPVHLEFHNVIQAAGVDPLTIREEIMPEIFDVIETGVRGYRERLAQMLLETLKGVTSSTAT